MKFTSGQIVALIIWGSGLISVFVGFGLVKHWIEPAWLFVPLGTLVAALVGLVVSKVNKAIADAQREADQAKSDVAIERARSEIPPALKDATIVVTRPRMPSVADLTEVAADSQATSNTTNVSIEVKS